MSELLSSPFFMLAVVNVIGALAWFGKGVYERLHKVESAIPNKVEMNTFNATVESLRRRQDENTDKLITSIASLERSMSERHINLLSAVGRNEHGSKQ